MRGLVLSTAAALVTLSGGAYATPLTIMLDAGGGNTLTIVDGDANDDSPLANHIQIQSGTTLGNFVFGSNSQLAIQSTTGLLDSNFHLLTPGGGGTLSVQVSKDDYALPIGSTVVTDDFSLTNIGQSISYASYLSTTNTMFGTDTLLHSNVANDVLDDEFASVALNLSGPYALTHIYTITQGTGQVSNFVETTITTPEPASLALLGLGAIGLATWRRRKAA
jgi:hypothetical protein